VLLAVEVLAAGRVAGVGVALAGSAVLPPQEPMAIMMPIKTVANITFLIIYFSPRSL
jgi:uncharacterized membrane protein